MSGDVLFDAVRALRDSADDAPAQPEETRARVMSSLRERRARRVLMIKTFVPLAAVLVGSLAWAAPGKLPAIWKAVVTLIGTAEPASETDSSGSSSAAPRPRKGMGAPGSTSTRGVPGVNAGAALDGAGVGVPEPSAGAGAAPAVEAPAQAALNGANVAAAPVAPAPPRVVAAPPPILAAPAPVLAAPAPALEAPAPVLAGPAGAAAPAAAQSETEPPAQAQAAPVAQSAPPAEPGQPAPPAKASEAGPDTHALYKKAHQAHFIDKNPSAALRAWDDYLRADPRGRFSVEAHYNRALCLVRLGRSAEARRALDGFARGAFGGYRQAEARALLEALGGDAPR